VDIVCVKNNKIVLVELKTGWDDVASYDASCGALAGPVEALRSARDSPRNQHRLQLLVTRYLFSKTFGIRPESVLMRVSADGVRFERLPSRLARLEGAVVAAVAEAAAAPAAPRRRRSAASAVTTTSARRRASARRVAAAPAGRRRSGGGDGGAAAVSVRTAPRFRTRARRRAQ